jgi:hypothetical protein
MSTYETAQLPRRIRSRHIRNAAGVRPIRLTTRDVDLLSSLADFRVLTTTQVQRLFFRSLHRARKRLFKLWQHGMVDRVFRPVSLGESPSEAIYTMAAKGARLLAQQRGSSEQASREVIRRKKISPFFLEHSLAVNSFRIALTIGCGHTYNARFLSWRQGAAIGFEQIIADPDSGGSIVRVPVVADGLAEIEVAGHSESYFVEVDRGTVPLRRWRRRYAAYLKASRDEILQKRLGISHFAVLIVTSGEQRMLNLLNVAKPYLLLNTNRQLFRFMKMNRVGDDLTDVSFGAIWQSCGHPGSRLTRIQDSPPRPTGQ